MTSSPITLNNSAIAGTMVVVVEKDDSYELYLEPEKALMAICDGDYSNRLHYIESPVDRGTPDRR